MKKLFPYFLHAFIFTTFSIHSLFASDVSLTVVRPELGERMAFSYGFTFVVGTVIPAQSTVTCNDVACEISEDGAFIGYVPIRRVKDWVEQGGRVCDAEFEFKMQSEKDEKTLIIPVYTPRSPTAAIPAMTLFDSSKTVRVLKDQWLGLEKPRLGDVLFIPKNSVLTAVFGNASNYFCNVSSDVEIAIPASETEIVDSSMVEHSHLQPLDISISGQKNITITGNGRTYSDFSGNEVFWGLESKVMDSGVYIQPRKKLRRALQEGVQTNSLSGFHICLDPGHHPDRGAVGPRGFEERESNLLLAYETAEILKAEGAMVSFTREAEPLPIRERHSRLHDLAPDLVISLHNNSIGDGQDPRLRHGTQTFYLYPWSKPLAESVHQSMLQKLNTRDLGCICRNLYITRFPGCPTILIEPEYIILPDQEKKFMDLAYRHRLAEAIVEGIKNFAVLQVKHGDFK